MTDKILVEDSRCEGPELADHEKVELAPGFSGAGIHCGIKRKRKDLGLIYSEDECSAAGIYTQNKICSASVHVTRDHLTNGRGRALIIASGVANTGTGEQGMKDAKEMARLTSKETGVPENDVLVASTGVIGVRLPMEKLRAGIPRLCRQKAPAGAYDFAHAVRTTDTFIKHAALRFNIGGKVITLAGIAKGSGMVHPNMATILAFITTDLAINSQMLHKALRDSAADTYNMISIDGETSTNDMALIMANGRAGNRRITSPDEDYDTLCYSLGLLNKKLSKLIVRDGEGATKLLEVTVEGAATDEDARIAARAVAKSTLVKTAMFGEDANWGRILCVLGYSGAQVVEDTLDIYVKSSKGRIQVVESGIDAMVDYRSACNLLTDEEVLIDINMNIGEGRATAYGCDLSYDYVRINGDLRSNRR